MDLRALALPGAEYLMPVLFPAMARSAGNAVGRQLNRLGIRFRHFEQEWQAYASLTEPANRPAFVRTLRSVIDSAARPSVPTTGCTSRRACRHSSSGAAATRSSPSSTPSLPQRRSRQPPRDLRAIGHFPHADDPELFAATLADFVATTSPLQLDEQQWRAALTAGPDR